MEMLTILFSLVVAALVGLICWLRNGRIKGIPEPPGNFILGHVFHVGGNFCRTFLKWKSVLGPVFQLRFFNIRVVVFNDRDSIAEVCAMPEASGRERNGLILMGAEIVGEGVAFGEGPSWAEQKQLLVKSMKTFGFSRPETERRFHDEIACTLREWEELKGAPFELDRCNVAFVFNSLWSVIASKQMDHSSVLDLARHTEKVMKLDTIGHKLASLSVSLAKKFTNAVEEKRQAYQAVATLARKSVFEHQKGWVKNEPRDVIDVVLDKMSETTDVNSAYHEKNLKNGFALGDTILATLDTTSKTLEWLMLYLARNPAKATKLHAEIDRIFGDDLESWPSLADRENMPYTQACVLEALRLSSVAAFGMPHKALEDFEFNGSLIPKGTILLMNFYGVHHDPQVWDRPEEFEPERFLTPEGDNIDLNVRNNIVSFGIGRRVCPGNFLALDSMFLFVVNVYRKFRFDVVGGNVGDCEGRFGVMIYPPKGIQLRAVARVEN